MPRLLFLTERYPPDIGGVATSARRIAIALAQLGMAVDVLTWSRYLQAGDMMPETTTEQTLRLFRVGRYHHWDATAPHTLNVLTWLHQQHPYDVVWGHYLFPGGFLAVWFARSQALPSIVSARGNDLDRDIFPPGDFARLHWTLTHADVVTAVSQDMARKVALLCDRQDAIVLKNAVDTQVFCPEGDRQALDSLRGKLGIAPEEVVLGFSGELRQKKGQRFLLPALTTVCQHYPARLLLVGDVRESEEAAAHLHAAQYPEAAQRVIRTGHFPDPLEVARHLRLCDVYLQPSLWEGMPNALLEAIACGCCCIASDAGGIPEIITHGEHGFLLPVAQLHHLGEAILECLALDNSLRQRVTQQGRNRIALEFSLAAERERLRDMLRGMGLGI